MIETPRVSVVDDDEQVRESLVALIGSMNVNVECYSSGQEFLNKYSVEPGCVVLDFACRKSAGWKSSTPCRRATFTCRSS